MNVSGDGAITVESLLAINATFVRLVLLPHFDLNPYIDACHARGIRVLGVVARESMGLADPEVPRLSYPDWLDTLGAAHRIQTAVRDDLQFDPVAAQYGVRYGGKLDAWQIGNESDHVSGSSWTLGHDDLNDLLRAFRRALPNAYIVGPGLVSGDPNYVRGIDLSLVNAISVHPYGQRPNDSENWDELPGNFGVVTSLIQQYALVAGLTPIWVTEFGVSTTECSAAFQGRYWGSMLRTLRGRYVFPFCIGDWMVPEFGAYGLDGNPKAAAEAFRTSYTSPPPLGLPRPPDPPKPPEPEGPPRFQLGFGKWAALEPGLLGRPLKNEKNTGFVGWQIQPTSTGVLQWHQDDGHVFVTHEGRIFRWEEDWPHSVEVGT